ncbi:Transcription factor bHLH51 [Triticum urartu]|uniref:Transcription factor bHLH51 n=1 Tax=Triticum urartu TaxID=4572 RepID=M7Z428_TRIUA|nr:Transcription factor bHLH51 [Triticum urartu]
MASIGKLSGLSLNSVNEVAVSKSWMAAPGQSPHDACDHTVSRGPALLPRQASSAPPAGPPELSTTSSSTTGSGRTAPEARALKVHSEAERRRRVRINAHLTALRRMIPDTKQMDKAALLARVVDQVRQLKRRASEAAQQTPAVPPETDEVSVEFCCTGDTDDDDSRLYIKASVSCDDRPDLVAGFIQALHGLRLRTLRAEVSSLGGRVQHVFTLCKEEEGSAGCAGLNSLKEAVRFALAKVASSELVCGGSPFQFQSKRQRILESHYSIMSI